MTTTEFEKSPDSHLVGEGCTGCRYDKVSDAGRSNREEFIKKAQEVHGEEYCYDPVVYIKSNQKVEILCLEHGSFWVTPNSHLTKGIGCRECSKAKRGLVFRSNTEEFITKSKLKHGVKYDYSETEYVTSKDYITYICPKHGPQTQKASDHLAGCGCYECGRDNVKAAVALRKPTTEEFVSKAKEVHGKLYIYDNAEYIDSKTPLLITCRIHGDFYQAPYNHLMGKGCKHCRRVQIWKPENLPDEFKTLPSGVYVITIYLKEYKQLLIKVGLSNDVVDRVARIKAEIDCYINILAYRVFETVGLAYKYEQKIHKNLFHLREISKSHFTGKSECYKERALPRLVELGLLNRAQLENFRAGSKLLEIDTRSAIVQMEL